MTCFLLTIDTEPDNVWADFRSAGLDNVRALARFHRQVCELGIRPTYLLTWSVVSDAKSAAAIQRLREIGPCEFGAHLHAWETPPFLSDGRDRAYPVFAHDLPLDLFREKLRTLSDVISDVFGAPVSYRAGRFGFCAEHVGVLESLGYRVESSVTPLLDRRGKFGLPAALGGKGGRDYRRAPLEPYHPDYSDDLRPGGADLLEVPVTVGPRRAVSEPLMAAHRRGPQLVQRVLRKTGISSVIHASPPEVPWPDLRGLVDASLAAGRRVFNFMLHSSEAMAGGAPWIRTEADVQQMIERIRLSVERLQAAGAVEFRTLSQMAERGPRPTDGLHKERTENHARGTH